MPGRDRTGPMGKGPRTGRGLGPCGRGLTRGFGRGFAREDYSDNEDERIANMEEENKELKKELKEIKKKLKL